MEESVTLTLDEGLLQNIVSGKRKRKLKNISIKMDPPACSGNQEVGYNEVYPLSDIDEALACRGYQEGIGLGYKIGVPHSAHNLK